jgi:hypothetical protein
MTDIIERLRKYVPPQPEQAGPYGMMLVAADEIERLRADKDVIRSQERNTAFEKDIQLLEAALEPFARNADARSLSEALGHISRDHLLQARAALTDRAEARQ